METASIGEGREPDAPARERRARFSALGSAVYGTVLAAAIVVAVVGLGLLRPDPAIGVSVAADIPPLVLTSDPPGTVHTLTPGETTLWNVGVTLHRMPASRLVGILTAAGGLASGEANVTTDVELRGCTTAWEGTACTGTERVILPPTATDALTGAADTLTEPSQPIPANVWVQARVTPAVDAPEETSGELQLRLTVDASGADATGGGDLAATGGQPPMGAALLGVAAVAGGFAIVGLARRRRHG
ncbi:LPXTG cell wall anchor domain-containing protein [Humibacter ginsengisoli]